MQRARAAERHADTPPRRAFVSPWLRSSSRFRRRATAAGVPGPCPGRPRSARWRRRWWSAAAAAAAVGVPGSPPRRRRVEHRLVRRAEVGEDRLHERGAVGRAGDRLEARTRCRPCRWSSRPASRRTGRSARAPSPVAVDWPALPAGRRGTGQRPAVDARSRRRDRRELIGASAAVDDAQLVDPRAEALRSRDRTTTDTEISTFLPAYAAGIGSDHSCQPPELPVAAFHVAAGAGRRAGVARSRSPSGSGRGTGGWSATPSRRRSSGTTGRRRRSCGRWRPRASSSRPRRRCGSRRTGSRSRARGRRTSTASRSRRRRGSRTA